MIKRTVFVLVLMSLILTGCRGDQPEKGTPHAIVPPAASGSQLPGTPDPMAGWVHYTNTQLRFSFRHPPDLQVQAEDASGTPGWIGPHIQYSVTAANPLDCRGDCPLVDTVDANAAVARRSATRFSGSIGSIGGRTPQQYMSFTFWIDDQYYTFTVFALKNGEAKDRVDLIWPLADEDRRLFEQIISTLEFGAISAAAPTNSPAQTPAAAAGTNAAPGSIGYLAPGTPLTMKNIFMVDAITGWGIGSKRDGDDHILRTQDGGNTWLDVTPAEQTGLTGSKRKQALGFFRSPQRAWVAYWGGSPAKDAPTLWSTSDSGVTWSASPPLDVEVRKGHPPFEPEFLYFVDSQHGWLMLLQPYPGNDQTIFSSEDGGLHWTRIFDPDQTQNSDIYGCCNTGLLFLDTLNGLISKGDGPFPRPLLEWSRDGGNSWWTESVPPANADLFKRSDCGVDALALQSPQSPSFVVQCEDPPGSRSQPRSFFYATRDRGQTWSFSPLPKPPLEKDPMVFMGQSVHLFFISPDYGWVIFEIEYNDYIPPIHTHIYQTEDGGKSWEPRATVYWSGQFSFVSALVGWAVATSGDQVALVKTTDGGQTWKVMEPKVGP